jgi:hypothetical protein
VTDIGVTKWLAIATSVALASLILTCTLAGPVDREYLGPERYPPKPAEYPVSVLSEAPKCPHEEIARLEISGGTRDKNIKLMEDETRQVGGDAVFLVHLWSGDFPDPDARLYGSAGIVLRWLEEDCRE